jgi:putative ABC transport system substrate-binding protein
VLAQEPQRARRIGVLSALPREAVEEKRRIADLRDGLKNLGWIDGQNLHIDYRSSAGNTLAARKLVEELIVSAPDVIVSAGSTALGLLLQATKSLPVVFVAVADPVGTGLIDSLARPGGNATGFTLYEFALSPKWLELLTQVAPVVKHVGVIRDPAFAPGIGQFGAIQTAASSFGVEVKPLNMRDVVEIDKAVSAFARSYPAGGLIVTGGLVAHRNLFVALAARHRLPTIYPQRFFVMGGGLVSYGPDVSHQYRRAAEYVDRILKGEKPANLPVQAPTKYELVVSVKTATALGLTIPPMLLARADEVIE